MSSKINVIIRGQSTVDASCVYRNKVLKSGVGFQEQVSSADTVYIIKWNYDLGGAEITVPERCVLHFAGGRVKNGTIHWNGTKIYNPYQYEVLQDITEDGDKIVL